MCHLDWNVPWWEFIYNIWNLKGLPQTHLRKTYSRTTNQSIGFVIIAHSCSSNSLSLLAWLTPLWIGAELSPNQALQMQNFERFFWFIIVKCKPSQLSYSTERDAKYGGNYIIQYSQTISSAYLSQIRSRLHTYSNSSTLLNIEYLAFTSSPLV